MSTRADVLREAATAVEQMWLPAAAKLRRMADEAAPYTEVWDASLPPGGRVCSICGQPVESEPCPDHAPAEPTFFEPGHTYSCALDGTDWQFRCDTITRHPEDGERTALGWRFFSGSWEPCEYGEPDWQIHLMAGLTDETAEDPRTERSYWEHIAAALNAVHAAGLWVSIDLDGTLTNHTWSVVWDRATERWTVAAYGDEDADDGLTADERDVSGAAADIALDAAAEVAAAASADQEFAAWDAEERGADE